MERREQMEIIKRDIYVLRDDLKTPIEYAQGSDAIPIEFTFRDYTIKSGTKARVYVEKASGKAIYNDITANIKGNVITVYPTKQMFAESGIGYMQLEVLEGQKTLMSFVQPLDVKKSLIKIDSENGQNFFEEYFSRMETATNAANEATKEAKDTTAKMEDKAQKGDFSASVAVGSVVTGEPGSAAAVKNVGTVKDAVFEFSIPRGYKGDSGITVAASGMFTLWVDSEKGDLYVDYPDGEEPPKFEYEESTGDLYIIFEEGEVGEVGRKLIGHIRNPLIANLETAEENKGALDAKMGKELKEKIEEAEKNAITNAEIDALGA